MPQVFEIRISQKLRVREEIKLHFYASRRPHGKARGGRIAGYLTDEQRSQAGWIGALKCEVIFERALSLKELTLHNWRSQQGFAILWLIAIIIAFAALGSAMVATYNVSLFGQVETGLSLAAESMAESGYRFLFSEYQNESSDKDKNKLLDEIRFVDASTGKIFNISPDGGGQFQLEMTSYFYRVKTDPGGGSSLALKFIGEAGFSVPDSGFLKVGQNQTFYEYTSPPATSSDTDGSTIYTFTVTPNVPATAEYTSVRQVIETNISSDVNQGGTLVLESGQGDLFPSENGMFLAMKKKIKEHLPVKTIVPYRYKYDSINGDQLVDIQAGPYQSSFISIDGDTTLIEIAKLLRVDSIGFAPDKASALASETNTFKLSLDISALSSGLKSYWSFDDAASPAEDDYGVSEGTLGGGSPPTPGGGKVGGALEFSGAGYVSTTFNPRTEIGSQQSFTVVFWAKPNTVSGFQAVVGSGDWSLPSIERFYIGLYDDEWIWGYGDLFGDYLSGILPDATANQWQHIAYVYDKDLDDIIIYVNGIEKYRFEDYTLSGGSGLISNVSIDIGGIHRQGEVHNTNFDGTIDEVAIFNTALDICEIREIYDVPCNVGCGTFNTANDPGVDPVAYYPFNCDENDENQSSCSAGDAVDESGTDKDGNPPDDNDGTVNGAVLATDRFGCADKAYSFDGSSAYISAPHSDSLELSDVNRVTVGAWVNKASGPDGKRAIVQKSDKSYILRFDNNEPRFIIDQLLGGKIEAVAPTVTVGVWYHVVGTFNGIDVKIYVDGDFKSSMPIDVGDEIGIGSASDLGIGENLDKTGRFLEGAIDDISIWDQAMTADQVLDYYNQTSHK